MFAARFKVATHLRTIIVVIALASLLVVPNTRFADIDIRQRGNVIVNLLLELIGQASPMRITRVPIEPRVTDVQTTNTATVTGDDGKFVQDYSSAED